MPKIDPITGCTVQTLPEFWAGEAEREGKGRSGGDLMAEFFDDLDADCRREEARLSEPAAALDYLQAKVREWNGLDPDLRPVPLPVVVDVVESVTVTQSFRSSSTSLTAIVRTAGRRWYRLDVSEEHWSGSFYEPPDYDCNVVCTRLPGNPNPGCK